MGIFRKDDNEGIERLFIELDDAVKGQMVYKWPDQQIRARSRVTVDMDYTAVFTQSGKVIGTLGPGRHKLDQGASMPMGWLVDHLTADGFYDCELYFVTTRQFTNVSFGGPVDHVQDPQTGFVAGLRVFGEFAARVVDPVLLITSLVGSMDLVDDSHVFELLSDQVLAAIRESASILVASNGLYGLGSRQPELESTVSNAANLALGGYGLEVTEFAQLNLNMDDDTVKQMQEFAAAKGYIQLAGSWDAYTRGQAMMNLADGNGGSGGDGNGDGGMQPLLAAAMLFSAGGRVGPDSAPPSVSPPSPQPDLTSKLEKLVELHQSGMLDEAEFISAKKQLLGT